MTVAVAAVWGLAGGVTVVTFATAQAQLATGRWPWRHPATEHSPRPIGLSAWLTAVVLRIASGTLTATAAGAAGTLPEVIGPFVVGALGPAALRFLVIHTFGYPADQITARPPPEPQAPSTPSKPTPAGPVPQPRPAPLSTPGQPGEESR
jgi:hypothetical protein